MTNKQIGIFDSFLRRHGASNMFSKAYESHKDSNLSEKEYKKNVHPLMALRYAFPWESFYQKTYWEDLNDNWESVCIRNGFTREQNYDESKIKENMRTLFNDLQTLENRKTKMEDFTFFDFGQTTQRSGYMKADEFSLNHTKNNYTVTLNMEVSNMIREGKFDHLRIRMDNITGEIHLIFTRDKGLKFRSEEGIKKNVSISSKEMVQFLVHQFGINDESGREIIKISKNLANSNDFLTFKILRDKTIK